MAMLKIVIPFSLVLGAIHMGISSKAMRFVLTPLAIKNVSVSMPEDTPTVCFAIYPAALILSPIWPDLDPVSMSELATPLSFINSTILKSVLLSEL